jgi:hypothetical protein
MVDSLLAQALDVFNLQGIRAASVKLGKRASWALQKKIAIQHGRWKQSGGCHRQISEILE